MNCLWRSIAPVVFLSMGLGACGPIGKDKDKAEPDTDHKVVEPGPGTPDDPAARLARTCSAEHQETCQRLVAEIAKARAASLEAVTNQDFMTAMAKNLEVEQKTDALDLYRNNEATEAALKELSERYKVYADMLAATPLDPQTLDPAKCIQTDTKRCQFLRRTVEQKLKARNVIPPEAQNSIAAVRINLFVNFVAQNFPLLSTGNGSASEQALALGGRYELMTDMLERLATRGAHPSSTRGLATCLPQLESECFTLEDDLLTLRRDFAAAIASGDGEKARAISWQINAKDELLDVLRSGFGPQSEPYLAVVRKYDALRNLWTPGSSVPGLKPYTEREALTVKRVFQDFGPLNIKESPIKLGPDGKPLKRPDGRFLRVLTTADAGGAVPWTGYWYRTRTNLVSRDPASPLGVILGKFDALSKARGEPVETLKWEADYERSMSLSPNEIPEWEGLCDAWAMASMLRPEPVKGLQLNGIKFTVGELKGLLTKLYQNNDSHYSMATSYGFRYDGNAATDGELQDPRPEAFHRIVEVMLGEKKLPFGVDSDPGMEVWNKPLYKMAWSVEPDPTVKDAFLVTAYPRYTRQINQVSNVPTAELMLETEIVEAPTFTYRLYTDPLVNDDGSRKVIYGEWLNETRDIHPDSIFIPDRSKEPKPVNKELARGRKTLEALFSQGTPVRN